MCKSFWELASALAWTEDHKVACKFSSLVWQFCSVAVSTTVSAPNLTYLENGYK